MHVRCSREVRMRLRKPAGRKQMQFNLLAGDLVESC